MFVGCINQRLTDCGTGFMMKALFIPTLFLHICLTFFQNVATLSICDRNVINGSKNLIGLKSGIRLGMPILHNDQRHANNFVT